MHKKDKDYVWFVVCWWFTLVKLYFKNMNYELWVMKFKDFRSNHPFLIADRMEDLTEPDLIRQNAKCDRNVYLYGYDLLAKK